MKKIILALFLLGGTAYGVNQVQTANIANLAVTSPKVAKPLTLQGSDSLGSQFVLEGPNGVSATRSLSLTNRENGDFFAYNPSGNIDFAFDYANRSFYTGNQGGVYHLEGNYPDADTSPATISKYSGIGSVNPDTTDGNYNFLAFQGEGATAIPDSAIVGIHDTHGGSGTTASGSLEFWTRSAGTFARRLRIAVNGALKLDGYGAGLLQTDSSGNVTAAGLNSGNILVGNTSNQAASVTPSGDVTSDYTGSFIVKNASVIGKLLTGYVSGAGTVSATDTILQAINKLNGNAALNQPMSTLTTKGDLYCRNGSVVTRLPVSADGTVLTAQSGATCGVQWAAPSGGGSGATTSTEWANQGTIAITATTSNPTKGTGGAESAFWRRVGDSMEVTWQFYQTSGGADGVGTYLLTVPNSQSIDTAKVTVTTSGIAAQGSLIGFGKLSSTNAASATQVMPAEIYAYDSTHVWMILQLQGSANQRSPWNATFFPLSNTVQYMQAKFTVPISGWTNSN